jgi:hypothetical protein
MKMEYAIEGAFSVSAILKEIVDQVEVPKQFITKR